MGWYYGALTLARAKEGGVVRYETRGECGAEVVEKVDARVARWAAGGGGGGIGGARGVCCVSGSGSAEYLNSG